MTTMDELLDILGAEEPDYAHEALSDPEIVPLLREIVEGSDLGLAAKAVGAASAIDDEEAHALVRDAAASGDPVIRSAVAAAAVNLPVDAAAEVVATLVQDEDAGVRYLALGAVPESAPAELLAAIESISQDDAEDDVRQRAEEILQAHA